MAGGFNVSSAAEASAAIAGLARTNTDEVCLALLETLRGLEERALPPQTLLEVAEVLRPVGDEAVAGFRSGYADRALPLGDEEAKRFGHALSLLQGFERIYQLAFDAGLNVLPDHPARARLPLMIQRCMACVVGQMIEHYRAQQITGMALWKRLQQHMQAAVREKLDTAEVPDPLDPRGVTTPQATYGRALLLSIAQAGAMTHRNLEATLALTASFAHLVEVAMLDAKDGGGSGTAGVGIKRTGRIRVVAVAGMTHLVNTTRIDSALGGCIQRLSEGASADEIGLSIAGKADLKGLLPRLRRIWCGAGEIREAERQPLKEQSAVAIGFNEIYKFACPSPLIIPKEFEVYGAKMPVQHYTGVRVLHFDQKANPAEQWQTLDYSATGMRAQRPQPGARLQRGQLLAVDFHGMQKGSGFALAEVRWLQQFTETDAGGIAAGVRFLSSDAHVAVLRLFGVSRDEYQTIGPAFVLSETAPPQLAVPVGWYARGRRGDIWYQERVQSIAFADLRARGTDYEIVTYVPAKPDHESRPGVRVESRWEVHMRVMFMLVVFAALGSGCAKSQEVWFADGQHKGYLITCEGIEGGMPECFKKADDLCGERGFDITHRDRRPGDDGRSLLIRCRSAA